LRVAAVAQLDPEGVDAGGDVVAHEAHAFDAVDAALGGFVGVPALDAGAVERLDVASRPRVMTTSASRTICSVMALGVSAVMSMPSSCSDRAERALTAVPGLVPADSTVTVVPAA